jgi:branched-chain amino acid transport system ATP-binding protein
MTAPVLSCRKLVAGYGKLAVVRDLDLEAEQGTVTAILGPNGAGKSTLLLTLAGLLPRLGGEVLIHGQPVADGRPAATNRAGIVLIPDDRSLFTTMTVRENLAAALRKGPVPKAEIQDLFPALAARWETRVGSLSGGEQQMLAIARAIVQRPKVLLIDEMSMGLAPVTVESLLPVVRTLAAHTGAVVILVEQHVHLALEVADNVLVLVHGTVVLRGRASDLASDPATLEAAYLGEVVEAGT